MQARRSIAIVCVIVLMIVWGSTFVVTKTAVREIPPWTLAILKFLIASVVLIPVGIASGGFRRMPRPLPWRLLLLMALTGIAAFTITFNYAMVYGSAAQGALIYAALPAAIALAAVTLLSERLSKRRMAGIVLSMLGVALLIVAGESDVSSPSPVLGALWMLGAVISWTAYTVFAKRLAHADHVATIAIVSAIGTAMLALPAAVELMQAPTLRPSLSAWVSLLFLAIIATALAYIVYGFVLRELDASLVGAYTNLDPIVGVLIAVLFLGETLHGGQIVGGLIAFTGMWLASSEK